MNQKKGQSLSKSIFTAPQTQRRPTTSRVSSGMLNNSLIEAMNEGENFFEEALGSREIDRSETMVGKDQQQKINMRLSYNEVAPIQSSIRRESHVRARHSLSPHYRNTISRRDRDSILSPQDQQALESIVQDEEQFDIMFNEGLKESEGIDKDMIFGNGQQERILNTKQLIFVGNRQFEFTQFDTIFGLSSSPFLKQFGLSTSQSDLKVLKKKIIQNVPQNLTSCFCCGKEFGPGTKKLKIDACHFCQVFQCGDCVNHSFPFPIKQKQTGLQLRGKICKVCETKFHIKQKLDEIFRSIDEREKEGEMHSQELIECQQLVTQTRFEIEQQKLLLNNFTTDRNYKFEVLRNKLADIKEFIEKQERDQQILTGRIAQKKEIMEEINSTKAYLVEEIEQTKIDIQYLNEELDAMQKDKDFIRNYLRQLNPGKKQPMQSSFKPTRSSNQVNGTGSGDGNSLMMSNIETPGGVLGTPGGDYYGNEAGDYQEENVLGFTTKGGNGSNSTNSVKYRKHLSTVVENDNSASRKSRKSIAMMQSQQKACCDSGCFIF